MRDMMEENYKRWHQRNEQQLEAHIQAAEDKADEQADARRRRRQEQQEASHRNNQQQMARKAAAAAAAQQEGEAFKCGGGGGCAGQRLRCLAAHGSRLQLHHAACCGCDCGRLALLAAGGVHLLTASLLVWPWTACQCA